MENTSEKRGGYYAVIPANVRYDKSLNAQCKLLYAEITALTTACGYCWASNGYFAELYGVDEATVSRWIKKLADKDYITLERGRKTDGTYKSRKIYVVDEPLICSEETTENDHMTKMQCGQETTENSHIAKMQCGRETTENDHIAKMQCGREMTENSYIAKMQCGQRTSDSHIANLQNNHIAKMQDNNIIYSGKNIELPSNEGVNARARPRGNTIPTLEEVKAYCKARRNDVDAARFYDFYLSNGWRVGKNRMRDWRAAVRRWETRDHPQGNADSDRVVYERISAAELNAMFTKIGGNDDN